MKQRLDELMAKQGLVNSRSNAATLIDLGFVEVNGRKATKAGYFVDEKAKIKLLSKYTYVSRAGYKLDSVARQLNLNFKNKIVLDVGSSTGGFTDFALQNGALKVYAVDVGTKQLHKSLLSNPKIELHENTDIRQFEKPDDGINFVLIDVSFLSVREVLPSVSKLVSKDSEIVVMVKPQFEAGDSAKHKGVVKNAKIRKEILKDFESWTKKHFAIINKADSHVAGDKGNIERFYLLKLL